MAEEVTTPKVAAGEEIEEAPRPGLNSALELDIPDAAKVQQSRPTTMVTILGAPESGKTGVLAGIYLRLKKGTFGGAAFSSSMSLKAFEKRKHSLTIESGRTVPGIDRTPHADGVKFLHLEIYSTNESRKINLLLSDISGELCERARNSTHDAVEIFSGVDSDVYVFTIDGKKLTGSVPEKASEIGNAHQLFRSMLDSNVMGGTSRTIVVLTKVDLVLKQLGNDKKKLKALEQEIEKKFLPFKSRVASLDSFSVAASPEFDATKFADGHEFKKMAMTWLVPGRPVSSRTVSNVAPTMLRQIDRLNEKPGVTDSGEV